MTSTAMANRKADKQAQENAARLWREWYEKQQKEIAVDAAGNLYWAHGGAEHGDGLD